MIDDPSLVSGGDCHSHYHSSDRSPSKDLLEGLQGLMLVKEADASYTASLDYDYHFITAAAPVSVLLPKPRSYRLVTFVRVSGASNVTLTAPVGETINGGASLILSSSYSPVRLLAIPGIGYVQV